MKTELKNKWIKALRSGNYQQTTEILSNGGCYCCLGVLSVIMEDERFKYGYWTIEEDGRVLNEEYEIPKIVKENIDLPDDVQTTLIDMNDNQCNDFNEIADWIEKNL